MHGTGLPAADLCAQLAKRRILCNPTAKYSVRMVTHFDVDRSGIDRALAAMSEVCAA